MTTASINPEHVQTIEKAANYWASVYTGKIPGHDRDDLVSVGTIGGLEKASEYDETTGNQFSTFINPYVRGAMTKIAKRMHKETSIPTDEDGNQIDFEQGRFDAPEAHVERNDRRTELVAAMERAGLPTRTQDILFAFAAGTSNVDIAKEIGISAQRVGQIINSALAKLRDDEKLSEI